MPKCSRCPTKQAKLNRGNLCTSCFQSGGVDSSLGGGFPNHNMSLYSDTSFSQNVPEQQYSLPQFNALHFPNISNSNTDPTNQSTFSSNNQFGVQQFPTFNVGGRPPGPSTSVLPGSAITAENLGGLMNKPISELTVADIIQINMISNRPMQQQLSTIEAELRKKIQQLENRANVLEKQNTSITEENTVLRDTICYMQKSLNKIDSNVRNKNVIITGLPEGEIPTEEGALTTDFKKIESILTITGNRDFVDRTDNLTLSRLGEEKVGYNRVVKIELASVEERDSFLKDTTKMKDAPPPWNKVYIKKDQHPVYLNENKRLRRKAYELKKKQGNENKDIKIVDGKVLIDGVVVDKNLFFR